VYDAVAMNGTSCTLEGQDPTAGICASGICTPEEVCEAWGSVPELEMGGPYPGEISQSDEVDVYKLEVVSAGTLHVYTTGTTDTYGELTDASCEVIAENDDGYTPPEYI